MKNYHTAFALLLFVFFSCKSPSIGKLSTDSIKKEEGWVLLKPFHQIESETGINSSDMTQVVEDAISNSNTLKLKSKIEEENFDNYLASVLEKIRKQKSIDKIKLSSVISKKVKNNNARYGLAISYDPILKEVKASEKINDTIHRYVQQKLNLKTYIFDSETNSLVYFNELTKNQIEELTLEKKINFLLQPIN